MEKAIALWVVDSRWKEHLLIIDSLKEGMHLRAHAQTDPLVEYQKEAYLAYQEIISSIKEGIIDLIFKTKVTLPREAVDVFVESEQRAVHSHYSPLEHQEAQRKSVLPQEKLATVKSKGKKIGRNEPCPCGSGKKYKKCCGR